MYIRNRLDLFFSHFKLRDKFIFSYIIMLLIPLIIVSGIFYNYYKEASEKKTRRIIEQTIKQTSLHLQNLSDQVVSSGEFVMNTYSLQKLLSTENYGTYEEILEIKELDSIIGAILSKEGRISGIRLYVNEKKIYANNNRNAGIFPITEAVALLQNGSLFGGGVLYGWTKPYNLIDAYGKETTVVSYVVPIYDWNDISKLVGAIFFDLDPKIFIGVIDKLDLGVNEMFIISDSEKKPFVSHGAFKRNGIDASTLLKLRTESQGSEEDNQNVVSVSNQGYTIMEVDAGLNGWKLIMAAKDEDIVEEVYRVGIFALSILLIVILTAVLSAVLVSNGITSKLRKLSSRMRNIHEILLIDEALIIDADSEDEVGMLDKNFKKMVEKIKGLVQENYEAGMQKKDIELKLLQSQINPHFLYNALESINWMSIRAKNYGVSDMLSMLGRYYRISLSKGKDVISLDEEAEHAKLYIKLQKNRFEDRINECIEIEEEVRHCKISKLVLQPLVENAVEHGILPSPSGKGEIIIKARRQKENVEVYVKNTGKPADLEKIQKCLSGEEVSGSGGYGLRNVNQRIKLLYGEEYGLKYSIHGGYTIAQITIPFICE